MGMTPAERQAQYRVRKAAGLVTPRVPRTLDHLPAMSDDEWLALEHRVNEAARVTLGSWLTRQQSPNTRAAYRYAWQAWAKWCWQRGIDPVHAPKELGPLWLAEMQEAGLSAQTRHQRVIAVGQALLELTLDGVRIESGDPFARINVRAIRRGGSIPPPPLTDDEVRRLLAAATGSARSVVLLLSVVGLRSMEVVQVRPERIRESAWGPVCEIVRKGGSRSVIPVPAIVAEAGAAHGWPMDEARSKRSSRPAEHIRYLVERTAAAAGLRVKPHQLRHWHVTVALREGVPLQNVQDSVGHSDPRTTQGYNRARVVVEGHSAFTVAGLLA